MKKVLYITAILLAIIFACSSCSHIIPSPTPTVSPSIEPTNTPTQKPTLPPHSAYTPDMTEIITHLNTARATKLVARGDYGPIYPFEGAYISSQSGDTYKSLYGFVNASGKIVVDAVYHNITPLYTKDTNELVAYAIYNYPENSEALTTIALCALDGSWITDFSYNSVESVTSHGICLSKGDKYGILSTKGKVLIDFTLDAMHEFYDGLSVEASESQYFYFIDISGKTVIEGPYFSAYDFSEGLAAVSDWGLFKYIDTKGNTVIPAQFTSAGSFVDGYAIVSVTERFGVIDNKGNFVIAAENDDIRYDKVHKVFTVTKSLSGNEIYYFYPELNLTKANTYNGYTVYPLNNGLTYYTTANGAMLVNTSGNMKFFNEVSSITMLSERRLLAKLLDGSYKVMDINGNSYTDKLNYAVTVDYAKEILFVTDGTYHGAYDFYGRVLLDVMFENAIFVNGVYDVNFGSYSGVINPSGKWLTRVNLSKYHQD